MTVQTICVRCRHVSTALQIDGGVPFMLDMMLTSIDDKICMRCGGQVRAVKDGENLPYEFVASARRMFFAGVSSAARAAVFWFVPALAIVMPTGDRVPAWVFSVAAIGAAIGFVLPLLESIVAARRDDLNAPHLAGLHSPGEGAVMLMFLLPAMAAGVAIFVLVVPSLAGGDAALRGWIPRALTGAVVGVLTAGTATRELFRKGRRAPSSGKTWRFGEEPK